MALPDLQDEHEEITAKMCLECKGEGMQRWETERTYKVEPCRFCRGTGRVPMSGTYPKT